MPQCAAAVTFKCRWQHTSLLSKLLAAAMAEQASWLHTSCKSCVPQTAICCASVPDVEVLGPT